VQIEAAVDLLRDSLSGWNLARQSAEPHQHAGGNHGCEPAPIENLRPQQQQQDHPAHHDGHSSNAVLKEQVLKQAAAGPLNQIVKSACSRQRSPFFLSGPLEPCPANT